jgi:8-oxo-dGTP pyrophosphatase MutT (NUDIX family)
MIYLTKPKGFNPRFEIVSCFAEYDGEILLLQRQDHKPQGGTWGVPAGKIDIEDEAKERAMARELNQETRLNPEYISYFKKVFVRYPAYDFVYHIFHKKFDEDIREGVHINLDEHKAYLWIPPKQSLGMNLIQDLDACIRLFYGI